MKEESLVSKEAESKPIPNDYLMYLILTREGFTRLLMDQPLGGGRILNAAKDFKNKRNAIKDLLTRYRLWKQQNFQCFYTGKHIPFTKLFSLEYQIEHTIPRSISFDSELKNLTVCDATYNNEVKSNLFPTECPNYNKSAVCQSVQGNVMCTPIKERVDRLIKPKVEELQKRIANLKSAARNIQDWEKDKKDANIRLRHYLQFELEYWEKKHLTFTVERKDWKDKWKNSQLVDTQIITKFARAYMKSLFHHVDVQKGSTVNEFKKIYEIKGNEQKDRSRHSHHAIDAAVLTLIPGSAKREETLKQYYDALERKMKFHTKPYPVFDITHISDINKNIIINQISRDKALVSTRKKIRKRGRVQFTKNHNEMIMQGDGIRGQLHKESFYGAIKINQRNDQGFVLKENGKYKLLKKNEEDDIWIVMRKPIGDIDFIKDIIIDELLGKHIKIQLQNGVKITELVDFNNHCIRHLRCRVKSGKGFFTNEKALRIKRHTHVSKFNHKREVLAQNDENYIFLLYESIINNQVKRSYRIINLFEIANLNIKNFNELKNEREFEKITITQKTSTFYLELKIVLKVGDRVIFYKENKEEINNENANKRLFQIFKFNELGKNTAYIYLINHIEANHQMKSEKGEKIFDPNIYQPRLDFTCDKLNCLFEGKDFEIKPDGNIILKL
jgi:CRISPR-associated endonuclease Csn1